MIDEPKQELLVQYFLDEVDPSTAERYEPNSRLMQSSASIPGNEEPLLRWPMPCRRWIRRQVFLNGFFRRSTESPARPSAEAPAPTSSG